MNYKDIFNNIYDNNGFGSLESKSGPGSTLDETHKLRESIKKIIKDKNIKSVVDIPCGDFNWMKEIVFNFESYIGGDIVKKAIDENNERYSNSRIKFIEFDILNDEIPTGDLLIVRDIIGHFPIEDGIKILKNILNSKCKYLLSTTWAKKIDEKWFPCEKNDVHRENEGVDYGRFYPVNLMSKPFDLPSAKIYLEEDVMVDNFDNGNRKTLALWDLDEIRNNIIVSNHKEKKEENNITIVTGLWNIKRDELGDGWNRSYTHYLDKLKQLLDVENNLIIFGDGQLKEFVFKHRKESNTFFIEKDLDWFKTNNYFELIQKIRLNPQWYQQVGWLEESTQAKLEYYNPLVMSKMFLLHDAKIMDPFDSEYMFWIDAGLANTVHPGYFTHDKVLDKLPKYISKFSFVCFPYETTSEIHGFEINKMNEIAGDNVNKVARGGFFGGPKNTISDINSIYYNMLMSTLQDGYMGTEESLFSIMTYKHSDLINYFEIEGNGLLGKFFEDLKNDMLEIKSENKMISSTPLDTSKVGLYVIGFNSPNQFETLVKSMLDYDANFIDKTQKYLLDNSTDLSTTPRYIELCDLYGFEHIKKDNLGICGGRQFIAEHFDASDLDVMIFSEDDMNFYNKPGEVCRNGFNRYAPNLYNKCLNIIQKENYDFLKINFSEFYGDNSTQWSWYNVPQHVRIENWPEKPNLPVQGLDPNAPRTKFNNIKSMDGLPYADGDIYYCNWTHFITKAGNKKMFIDTKFAHPYENTWMSFMYQETVKNVIKPGILLLTPVEHHRFDHYAGELRREN
jgi:SAM-dependent methyltransferase